MPHGDAADWAGIKSFMMIYGPLLLLGLNNLFIRNPERARTILISNIVALCSTTVIMVAVCYVFFKGKFPNSYYLATFLYAISITIMTILRGRMYIISAQVVQGLWKLLLLLFILGYVLAFRDMKLDSVILIFVPLSLLVTVLVGAVIICRSDILKNDGLPLEYFVGKEETQFCLKYIVSVFTAGASAYLEVLVLSVLCSKLQTAEYFSHYTIFTSIAVVFSGYVGFVLTPSIRKLPANYSYLVAGFNAKIFMICVAVFVVSLLVGTVGFLIFYAGR